MENFRRTDASKTDKMTDEDIDETKTETSDRQVTD